MMVPTLSPLELHLSRGDMKLPLKKRLYQYLLKNHGWIAKGELADLARNSDLHATGEATGRRLRELHEGGVLEVKYIKGHAYYRIMPVKVPNLPRKQLTLI